jgi:hypothetical protein
MGLASARAAGSARRLLAWVRELLLAREPGANAENPWFCAGLELLLHDRWWDRLRALARWLPALLRQPPRIHKAQLREFARMLR